MAMRQKVLQSHSGYPDLFIAEPRNGYNGFFLELKTDNVFKKDGFLKSNAHLEEQNKMLEMLRAKGYYAEFAIGYNDAVKKIDEYLERDKVVI